jgi:uncharacterized protein YcaQ
VPTTHHLSRAEARQVALRAQLLDAERPADLLDTVRRLTFLQWEPTAAVAPNADLVAWSRLGSSYAPEELTVALEHRMLVELHMCIRPAEDIALYRAEMEVWPGPGDLRDWQVDLRDWVAANDSCRRDILARLDADGPTATRDLPDTCAVPWRSSGWNNNRNVSRLLDMMVQRGEVAVAGRSRRDKLWDLAERVYPDDPVVPLAQAFEQRNELRLASLGIARAKAPATPHEPNDVGEAGEPATVEGTQGTWRVHPAYLDATPFEGRAALLSPFDRLVADRKRLDEVFEFDYLLEMYKPAAKRQWGYFALPVLYGDRLVGKLDATADRKAGVLRVNAVHEDVPFTREMASAVDAEVEALADWLGLSR